MTVTIRRMTEAEIPEVSGLLRECYAWLGRAEELSPEQIQLLQSTRGSEDTLRRESQVETYLVAHEATRIAGVVAVGGNEVTKLYVLPSRHRAGIGRTLYEAAESIVRLAGHAAVVLTAFPTAVPFYEAMGLQPIGVKESCGVLAGVRCKLMEKRFEDGSRAAMVKSHVAFGQHNRQE